MRKKPLKEMLFVLLVFAGIPLLMLQRPPEAVGTPVAQSPKPGQGPAAKAPSGGDQVKAEGKQEVPRKDFAHLSERNIFAENGTYIVPKDPKKATPVQEVKLLGIVNTGVRRALIIDPFGALLDLKTGDKIEGLEVKKITNTAVLLRMGNKDMELKVFAAPTVQQAAVPRRSPTGGSPQQPVATGQAPSGAVEPPAPQVIKMQRPPR
jgi:hypothetical protein